MQPQKHIDRDGQEASKIFDNRSLEVDYRNLKSLLKQGMSVLDVGCGTGAISKDIAHLVGPSGKVIGIDNTLAFIRHGNAMYNKTENLNLLHQDLFEFETHERFDLIISARVLQWLIKPKDALLKMKRLLKPNGKISILDYNHENIEWNPKPPKSMLDFYETFLNWRAEAGMNNRMANDLPNLFKTIGLKDVEVVNSDEYYERNRPDFITKVGIWSKVAGSTQMVEEGYLQNDLRLQAIEEYDNWVKHKAISMTMKLNEVRGSL